MSPDQDSLDCAMAPAPRHDRTMSAEEYSVIADLQERERLRIGFDLHDGPAQTLSAALLQIRLLRDADGEPLRASLDDLSAMLKSALGEMYALIDDLGCRSPAADGLAPRVEVQVTAFRDRHGLDCELTIEGPDAPVSRSMQIAVSRIIQEALSNVARHSGASKVEVRLHLSEKDVMCEIADDGCGFAMADAMKRRDGRERYGLISMRQRAELLDGRCIIDSAPGHGTRILVRIPVWRG
jgi:two-component system sensor histidine kinase DegS